MAKEVHRGAKGCILVLPDDLKETNLTGFTESKIASFLGSWRKITFSSFNYQDKTLMLHVGW